MGKHEEENRTYKVIVQNRRPMKRKDFITGSCTCGAMSLIGFLGLETAVGRDNGSDTEDTDSEPVNKDQVRQLLKFIDSAVNETDKERIFNNLGTGCLYSRGYDKAIIAWRDNLDEYFNRVQRGESTYWEKLEYDKERSVITLIGRKFQTCVCEYGQCEQPPESLCNYCCKRFQEELFGLLLEKKVRVRIDESIILGGERCSTTIFVG